MDVRYGFATSGSEWDRALVVDEVCVAEGKIMDRGLIKSTKRAWRCCGIGQERKAATLNVISRLGRVAVRGRAIFCSVCGGVIWDHRPRMPQALTSWIASISARPLAEAIDQIRRAEVTRGSRAGLSPLLRRWRWTCSAPAQLDSHERRRASRLLVCGLRKLRAFSSGVRLRHFWTYNSPILANSLQEGAKGGLAAAPRSLQRVARSLVKDRALPTQLLHRPQEYSSGVCRRPDNSSMTRKTYGLPHGSCSQSPLSIAHFRTPKPPLTTHSFRKPNFSSRASTNVLNLHVQVQFVDDKAAV